MGCVITLCRECRSIQKAEAVCTICGAPVETPVVKAEGPVEEEAPILAVTAFAQAKV